MDEKTQNHGNPADKNTDLVVDAAEKSVTEDAGAAGGNESVSESPSVSAPLADEKEPTASADEPLSGASEPTASADEPLSGASKPTASAGKSQSGEDEPISYNGEADSESESSQGDDGAVSDGSDGESFDGESFDGESFDGESFDGYTPPKDPEPKRVITAEDAVRNFKRIVSRAMTIRIVKSVLTGLSAALPILGILLLLLRFEMIPLGIVGISLISAGVFVIVSLTVFLILRQSGKSIAIRLDDRYKLKEKIQTMLAFKDDKSPMAELQRRDAAEAIETVKKTVIGIGKLWIYALVFLLSSAILGVSFIFNPIPEPPTPPPPEVPFEVTELQLAALSELISYVDVSGMDDPYKTNIVGILTGLLSDIKEATNVKEKDTLVQAAMEAILVETDNSSYAVEIMDSLFATEATVPKLLAKSLNYYTWSAMNEWEDFLEKTSDFRVGFVHSESASENPNEEKMVEDTKSVLLNLHSSITNVLEVLDVPEDDPLAAVLTSLASANIENADGTRVFGMSVLAEYITANGYTKTQREIDATVTALSGEIYRALGISSVNTGTGEYAVKTLSGIFDVACPAFERPDFTESSSGGSGDSEGGENTGGGIGAGPSYGSDDKVYDPYTNRFVEYGTILDKYYSIMFGKLEGGDYTEEERKALEEYFKILYGGFDESEEN